MVAAAAYAPPLRALITPVCSKATIPAKAVQSLAGPLERPTTPAMFAWPGVTSNLVSKAPACEAIEPFCQAPALDKEGNELGKDVNKIAGVETVSPPTLAYRPRLFRTLAAAWSVRKAQLLPKTCSA